MCYLLHACLCPRVEGSGEELGSELALLLTGSVTWCKLVNNANWATVISSGQWAVMAFASDLCCKNQINLYSSWPIVSILCVSSCYDHLFMEDMLLSISYILFIDSSITLRGRYFGKEM